MAELYAAALRELNFEVHIAKCLDPEAYDVLRLIPPPEIVFLDLNLNEKENAEYTVRQIGNIKHYNPEMTVIVVSGVLTPDLVQIATLQGAAAVKEKLDMRKQVDLWHLIETSLDAAPTSARARLAGPITMLKSLANRLQLLL